MSWTAPPAAADDGVSGTRPQIRQMSREPPMSEPTVHTYRAADAGLWVNSYLVETATGVLVFDTSLLVSDIEALRARLAAFKSPAGDLRDPAEPRLLQRSLRAGPGPGGAGLRGGKRWRGDRGDRRRQARAMGARLRNRVARRHLLPEHGPARPAAGRPRRGHGVCPGGGPGRKPRRQLFPCIQRRRPPGGVRRGPVLPRHASLHRRRSFGRLAERAGSGRG